MAFFDAFGVDVFKLAFQIINFLLILYLLNRFLFKRVLALLDERQRLGRIAVFVHIARIGGNTGVIA